MVDTRDSKSRDSNIMRVQVSPAALLMHIVTLTKIRAVLSYTRMEKMTITFAFTYWFRERNGMLMCD